GFVGPPLIQRAAKSNPINRLFRSASAVREEPTTTKQLEANQNQAPPVVRVGHPESRMKGFGGTNRKAIHTMKAKTKRCLELLDRVSEFFSEHPPLTFGTRGTALVGQIEPTADSIRAYGGGQVGGFGEFQGGVAERRQLATELMAQLREIELAAEAMDSLSAPVPAEQLQTPRWQSSQALLDTSAAFVTVLTPQPVQQAFIDRDFPATFVADLSTLATKFAAATGRKYAGRQTQKGGTLGVDQTAEKGRRIV